MLDGHPIIMHADASLRHRAYHHELSVCSAQVAVAYAQDLLRHSAAWMALPHHVGRVGFSVSGSCSGCHAVTSEKTHHVEYAKVCAVQ